MPKTPEKMNFDNFAVFAFATFLLNITPGNDMLYVATRSTNQGIRAGIVSALGIGAGCFVHIFAAVFGLSAVLAQSAWAFNFIKFAGAAYLIYLGIKSLLSKTQTFDIQAFTQEIPLMKVFQQGVFTNILNPKVALFFLAFLPQFVDVHSPNFAWEVLFLGIYFNISGTIVNILVAVVFGKIGNWLNESPLYLKIQEKITGLVLILLGVKIALTSRA